MLPLSIPTICLSLVAGALAGKAEIFVREGGSHPDTPDATVSAPSRIGCSLKCATLEEWRCGGFWYLTNGTCLLYPDTKQSASLSKTEQPSPETISSEMPAIYRRLGPIASPDAVSAPCSCPGNFTMCAGRCVIFLGKEVLNIYTEAASICAGLGAHLVTPRSQQEFQCALDESGGGFDTWLGYKGVKTYESLIGADGEGGITYSNWSGEEPGFAFDDNCIFLWDGMMYDEHCMHKLSILCQLADYYRPECLE